MMRQSKRKLFEKFIILKIMKLWETLVKNKKSVIAKLVYYKTTYNDKKNC